MYRPSATRVTVARLHMQARTCRRPAERPNHLMPGSVCAARDLTRSEFKLMENKEAEGLLNYFTGQANGEFAAQFT